MESSGSHGFTLIEIIVTVTLFLVLSSLFMASYSAFNNSQTVKQAASSLIRNLQAVRTNAASGTKPAGCTLPDTLVGYRVDFTGTGYTAQARCLVSGSETGVGPKTAYTLPTGVTFPSVPSSITFYALDRGASRNETISLHGFGTTVKVSVFASGLISDFSPTPTP